MFTKDFKVLLCAIAAVVTFLIILLLIPKGNDEIRLLTKDDGIALVWPGIDTVPDYRNRIDAKNVINLANQCADHGIALYVEIDGQMVQLLKVGATATGNEMAANEFNGAVNGNRIRTKSYVFEVYGTKKKNHAAEIKEIRLLIPD